MISVTRRFDTCEPYEFCPFYKLAHVVWSSFHIPYIVPFYTSTHCNRDLPIFFQLGLIRNTDEGELIRKASEEVFLHEIVFKESIELCVEVKCRLVSGKK